jgi:hypothetical protein
VSILNVDPAAVGLSAITEMVLSGEMAAGTAAGSSALTATKPMVVSADDAAFTTALNGAGASYLASAAEHVGQRTAYAGAQNISALTYVLNELLSSASIAGI